MWLTVFSRNRSSPGCRVAKNLYGSESSRVKTWLIRCRPITEMSPAKVRVRSIHSSRYPAAAAATAAMTEPIWLRSCQAGSRSTAHFVSAGIPRTAP